ncbi:MAG: hypothetical protein ACRC33_31140 [Gemmataceae bacterium]
MRLTPAAFGRRAMLRAGPAATRLTSEARAGTGAASGSTALAASASALISWNCSAPAATPRTPVTSISTAPPSHRTRPGRYSAPASVSVSSGVPGPPDERRTWAGSAAATSETSSRSPLGAASIRAR